MRIVCISFLLVWISLSPGYCEEQSITSKDIGLIRGLTEMSNEIRSIAKDSPQNVSPFLKDILSNGLPAPETTISKDLQALIESPPQWLQSAAGTDLAERGRFIYIFASRSMALADLVEMVKQSAERDNVTIVFRGIQENENLKDFFLSVRTIINKSKVVDPPEIIINPMLFKEFNVTSVPQILMFEEGKLLARAKGIYAIDWIEKQYGENNRAGDLGVYGELDEISEPDMIEVMKARLASIDIEEIRMNALSKFWDSVKLEELAPARKSRSLKLDPSIIVASDIALPDGRVIAKAGEKVNPLDIMPFTTRLIVFNPNRNEELRFVEDQIRNLPRTIRPQLLITSIDRKHGWDQLADLSARFNQPVFLLTPDVRARFNISFTPSVVYAEGKNFYVEETAVNSPE